MKKIEIFIKFEKKIKISLSPPKKFRKMNIFKKLHIEKFYA